MGNKTSNIKVSYLALIVITVYCLLFNDYWKSWKYGETPFVHDVDQYYSYLPATFIHHDLTFSYPHNRYWLIKAPNGALVPKGTCGMAIMYMPFFLLGHKVAFNSGDTLDGYSTGYGDCVHYGSIFYALLGLFFLRKSLALYFKDYIVAITLIAVFFGTNLLYFVLGFGELAHNYLFCLSSIFIWYTIKWHEKPKIKFSIYLGLLLGLMTLIRPTEILIGLIFLLYNVTSFAELKLKLRMFLTRWKQLIIIGLCFILMLSPQLIYWKYMTGNFFYFSYGSDERFFFNDPKIMNVLFSYRKGWLLYTPLMAFSIIGMFCSKKYFPKLFIPFVLYFIINIYLIASWWCWWFGGGFGMRAIVQSYSILSFFLAGFVRYIAELNWTRKLFETFIKYILITAWSVLICFNLVQTYQFKEGMIHYDGMTKYTYWLVFGKFSLEGDQPTRYWSNLKPVDYEKAKLGERD